MQRQALPVVCLPRCASSTAESLDAVMLYRTVAVLRGENAISGIRARMGSYGKRSRARVSFPGNPQSVRQRDKLVGMRLCCAALFILDLSGRAQTPQTVPDNLKPPANETLV